MQLTVRVVTRPSPRTWTRVLILVLVFILVIWPAGQTVPALTVLALLGGGAAVRAVRALPAGPGASA